MRKILLPFSPLYGLGARFYHWLYDKQIKKSVEFEVPVISVGNLSLGGTGKTPHVEYLINLLSPNYQIGTLSRGYFRKTKGYFSVDISSSADQAGDEALQIKRKFPQATVAVCEERVIGIPMMLMDEPDLDVIILDDAFQHRPVKPGLSILLTEYARPFSRDYLLPAGNLREPVAGAERADVVVVTRSPKEMTESDKFRFTHDLKLKAGQQVIFSSLEYGKMYNLFEPAKSRDFSPDTSALLVTGIASSASMAAELKLKFKKLHHLKFRDHHRYSLNDVRRIADMIKSGERDRILVTTEKDAMRLLPYESSFMSEGVGIYCVPVKINFSAVEKEKFDSLVLNFVQRKLEEEQHADGNT